VAFLYFSAFLFSFLVSLFFQKKIILFSKQKNLVDRVDERKIDKPPRPRLGGIGIFAGFAFSFLIISFILPFFDGNIEIKFEFNKVYMYLLTIFIIFLIGILDDLVGLTAYQKLPFEILAAFIISFNGFLVDKVSLPFPPFEIAFGRIMAICLTICWIVAITNAMNLIDGIDGLAGSIAVISGLSFFLINLVNKHQEFSILVLSMIGAVVAFLFYNFPPSKIYMGDSGSLFIGFLLATLSLKSSTKAAFGISFVVPITILFIPILDTTLSFFRRILKGKNPFKADKEHLHHKLIEKGFSEKNTLFILSGLTIFFSLIGVFSVFVNKKLRLFLFLITLIIGLSIILFSGYIKIDILLKKITASNKGDYD